MGAGRPTGARTAAAARQHGSALVFALITLVTFMLAALALLRSVESGTIVLGNVGFRQEASAASDAAGQSALDWLSANAALLDAGGAPGSGYFPILHPQLDPTGGQIDAAADGFEGRTLIDWDDDGCAYGRHRECLVPSPVVTLPGGLSARYVVERLCTAAGPSDAPDNVCATPWNASLVEDGNKGAVDYANALRLVAQAGPYYRVIVRVRGTRDATSFAETIVHF